MRMRLNTAGAWDRDGVSQSSRSFQARGTHNNTCGVNTHHDAVDCIKLSLLWCDVYYLGTIHTRTLCMCYVHYVCVTYF